MANIYVKYPPIVLDVIGLFTIFAIDKLIMKRILHAFVTDMKSLYNTLCLFLYEDSLVSR